MKTLTLGKKILLICVLISVMAGATAISFTYWKSGLSGSDGTKIPSINIGEGQAISSTVNIDLNSNSGGGKNLIPHTKTPNANEVTSVVFRYNVIWSWDAGLDPTDAYVGAVGTLSVTCDSIMAQGAGNPELVNIKTTNDKKLFEITAANMNIVGNNPLGVIMDITVTLNEPANRTQYEMIAGKSLNFTFTFTVMSADDIAQQ